MDAAPPKHPKHGASDGIMPIESRRRSPHFDDARVFSATVDAQKLVATNNESDVLFPKLKLQLFARGGGQPVGLFGQLDQSFDVGLRKLCFANQTQGTFIAHKPPSTAPTVNVSPQG